MRHWMIGLAVGALLCGAPAAAQEQTPPTPIKTKAGKDWRHKPTRLVLPPKIDGFVRGDVLDLSKGPMLDMSVAYDDDASRTHVNIYIYHAAMPSTALWFDVASAMIATNTGFGNPAPEGRLTAFALPGSDVTTGLRQVFAITQRGRSSGVAVVAVNDWVVKLRMTSGGLSPRQLDAAMDNVMRQIGWPVHLPPLAPATPLQPCATPMTFGPPASKAKADSAAMLLGAITGSLAVEDREKDRKAGTAPAQPALCVHTDRIDGRLPIYQALSDDGGYLIPLGDSGTILRIGKASLIALLDKEKPAPWSVTVMKLDRWVQYPNYEGMPPPAQAIDIIQREQPLSTTSFVGKGTQISVSPDALTEE